MKRRQLKKWVKLWALTDYLEGGLEGYERCRTEGQVRREARFNREIREDWRRDRYRY